MFTHAVDQIGGRWVTKVTGLCAVAEQFMKWLHLYSSFIQSSSHFVIHLLTHTQAHQGLTIRSNLGFGVIPKDTSIHTHGELEIEPPTLILVGLNFLLDFFTLL